MISRFTLERYPWNSLLSVAKEKPDNKRRAPFEIIKTIPKNVSACAVEKEYTTDYSKNCNTNTHFG